VQRVLSEYGYGQIKVSGVLDNATSAAIQKFERERNLPNTGRVSDRMLKELAAMVGHPIE
jgi:peptidoglycan hydrolase-like protein with peptidoglycan-binding domain